MASSSLYRSNQQCMIAGVMGGIAERFGWNANLLRLFFIAISLLSAAFPGVLIYLILWLIVPKKNVSLEDVQGYPHNIRTVQEEQQSNR